MPLILPAGLPAIDALRDEGTPVLLTDAAKAASVGSRVLRVAILNLMPIKETTELDFVRVLKDTPHNLQLEFMKLRSHTSKHTAPEHMERFYRFADEMMQEHWDGFIITGAPLDFVDYKDVRYWDEITQIFQWAHANVRSTLYVCWAAFAGMYYYYGVDKSVLPAKMFGVFPHVPSDRTLPIFNGMDDEYLVPHSRHIELRRDDVIAACKSERGIADGLQFVSESPDSGVHMLMARGGREFFITGHSEYAPMTLDGEYRRDVAKQLPINIPMHYYRNDDPAQGVLVRWRANGVLLYSNWLNHYVANN